MSHIKLHPTKGVNPHLGTCRWCGADNGEILLLGAMDYSYECSSCGLNHISDVAPRTCQKCRGSKFKPRRQIEEMEKICGALCASCNAKKQASEDAVIAGGVFFSCEECGSQGAIIGTSVLAQAVRKQSGIAPPNPVGIKFQHCCEHGVEPEERPSHNED
jgi:hypothetical protein